MRLAVLPLTLVVISCQAAPGPLTDDDVAALRALGVSYAQAVLAGDANAVADLYVEDAIEMPPNMPARSGKDAIRAGYEGGGQTTAFTMTAAEIEGRADLAYNRGTYSWTGIVPGMEGPYSESGKYLLIARRQESGSWLWTVAIWNSDVPPPAME